VRYSFGCLINLLWNLPELIAGNTINNHTTYMKKRYFVVVAFVFAIIWLFHRNICSELKIIELFSSLKCFDDSGYYVDYSFTEVLGDRVNSGNVGPSSEHFVKAVLNSGIDYSDVQCNKCSDKTAEINVRNIGAIGNGLQDDTSAIQTAIDQISNGGTVLIPDGVYLIDTKKHIKLKSNMSLKLTSGATLKAIENDLSNYSILRLEKLENVKVMGGTLQGDRSQHHGVDGEWGMGLEIYASKNILITGVNAIDNWGDGFYVGNQSKNIIFDSVVADNNRRQGMSITSAEDVIVKNSIFKNTNGALPMDGLDLEPNRGETVKNIQILNSKFLSNKGCGIESTVSDETAGTAFVKNIIIEGNTVKQNGAIDNYSAGIKISRQSGQIINNNIVEDNLHDGIIIVNDAFKNIVSNNRVTGNGHTENRKTGFGILMYNSATENVVINNLVFGNKNDNIFDDTKQNNIKDNYRN
jgi:parallel beta-helix repeat protein